MLAAGFLLAASRLRHEPEVVRRWPGLQTATDPAPAASASSSQATRGGCRAPERSRGRRPLRTGTLWLPPRQARQGIARLAFRAVSSRLAGSTYRLRRLRLVVWRPGLRVATRRVRRRRATPPGHANSKPIMTHRTACHILSPSPLSGHYSYPVPGATAEPPRGARTGERQPVARESRRLPARCGSLRPAPRPVVSGP